MGEKKMPLELVACAEALRKVGLSAEVLELEALIEEGYRHLKELRASPKCNPLLISSLASRIDRAESLLEQKKKSLLRLH